jgi:clan AA aspartic protease (TIGR02281 family)
MADFFYGIDKRLILVPVVLHSPMGSVRARFVFDTGASLTIVDYRIAETIGYESHHAVAPSQVSSASGKEHGFRIKVASFETLGKQRANFEVACHALLEQGVEGLIGMNFIEQFDFCVYPSKNMIRI